MEMSCSLIFNPWVAIKEESRVIACSIFRSPFSVLLAVKKYTPTTAAATTLQNRRTVPRVDDFFKKEIHHFFEVYKHLENKMVTVHHWHDKALALNIIREARKRYMGEKKN